MAVARTPIHAASNGDRWFLYRGEDPADVFVHHEPNGPSGGRPSSSDLHAFLASGEGSPERIALLKMIGSLVEGPHASSRVSPVGPEPGAAGAEPSPGEESSTT